MDRKQANVLLAVILETVAEASAIGAPAGIGADEFTPDSLYIPFFVVK